MRNSVGLAGKGWRGWSLSVVALALASQACTPGVAERSGELPFVGDVFKDSASDENPVTAAASVTTAVVIRGEGFVPRLGRLGADVPTEVPMEADWIAGDGRVVALAAVRRVDDRTLHARLAAPELGLALTEWVDGRVRVRIAEGIESELGGGLRLSGSEAPIIETAEVERGQLSHASRTSDTQRAVWAVCDSVALPTTTPESLRVSLAGLRLRGGNRAELRTPGSGVTAGAMTATAVTSTAAADETTAAAVFAAGLPVGTIDLRWTNPDGQRNTLPGAVETAWVAVPCPDPLHVASIDPGAAVTAPETIYAFDGPIRVTFDAAIRTASLTDPNWVARFLQVTRSDGTVLTAAVSAVASEAVEINFRDPAALPGARYADGETYTVRLLAGRDGWERADASELSGWLAEDVAEAFQVFLVNVPPQLDSVVPRFAYRGDPTRLDILGDRFEPVPAIGVVGPGGAYTALKYPLWLTTTAISGVLAADLARPVGYYSLLVTNPLGGTMQLSQAVFVTDTPVPRIHAISPEAVESGLAFTMSLTGADFPQGFTVAAVRATTGGGLEWYPATGTAWTSDSAVSATFPAFGTIGSWVIRLFGPEIPGTAGLKLYTDYAALVVYSPSGNTGTFVQSPLSLTVPRMQAGAAAGRDSLGNRYLYVVGGRSSVTESALASVEVFTVDVFGRLSAATTLPARQGYLQAPRHSHGIFSDGAFVFAAGGVTDDTGWPNAAGGATASIERARVLDPVDAPEVAAVEAGSLAGTLAAGFWSVRVATVRGPAHPDNPGGETLASASAGLYLPTQGSIDVSWQEVPGAVSYRVYRTPAVDTPPGKERLVAAGLAAGAVCSAGLCRFIDTGLTAGSDAPLPPGALGVWHAAPITLGVARANFATAKAVAGVQGFVYFVGGENGGGVLSSYGYAALDGAGAMLDDGGSAVTLATMYEQNAETTPYAVAGAGIAVASSANTPLAGGDHWLVTGGGRLPAGTITRRINRMRVDADGSLTDFCSNTQGQSVVGCANLGNVGPQAPEAREAPQYFIIGDYLAQIAGHTGTAATNANGRNPLSASLNIGNVGANPSLTTPRAFFGHVRLNGINYFFGGTADGTTALSSIEQVER